jgi:hypothetical protein
MARTGIRNLETRWAFVSAVLRLANDWSGKTMTAAGRAGMLVAAANKALGAYNVPAVQLEFTPQSNRFGAEFGHDAWKISLDRRAFEGSSAPSNTDMAELADGVYHESRHAEQWFLVARFCLSNNMTVDDLAQRGLKLTVAQAAAKYPVKEDSAEEELATKLAKCLMTPDGVDRILETQRDLDVLSEGSKATKKEKELALERLVAHGYLKKGETSVEKARKAAHRAYSSQFAEVDAWDTGRLVRELFLQHAKKPLPPIPKHRL